jgi:hypothetical protein
MDDQGSRILDIQEGSRLHLGFDNLCECGSFYDTRYRPFLIWAAASTASSHLRALLVCEVGWARDVVEVWGTPLELDSFAFATWRSSLVLGRLE